MISETWFCVCMTQLSHLGPSVPHSLIFCTLKYTKMKKNIQSPVSIKQSLIRTLPSSLVICCLWFLLYSNSRAEQLADTAWPIQYLLFDLSWKKSVLDLVGQSERQIAQFSVRPQRAEPSLWIPTSPPHLVSPAFLLPSSVLLFRIPLVLLVPEGSGGNRMFASLPLSDCPLLSAQPFTGLVVAFTSFRPLFSCHLGIL